MRFDGRGVGAAVVSDQRELAAQGRRELDRPGPMIGGAAVDEEDVGARTGAYDMEPGGHDEV
jgi:hypothetical protein